MNHPILFSILYSFGLIAAFYTHKLVLPSVSQLSYRLSMIFLFSVFGLLICKFYGLFKYIFIWHESFLSINCMISTVMMFLGPIVQFIVKEYNFIRNRKKFNLFSYLGNLIMNCLNFETFKTVILSPFFEEIIYRITTCTVWMDSGISLAKTVWFSPFIFGISHFHHYLWEYHRQKEYLMPSIIQIGFTTVFGWWAAYVWCRTHNFLSTFFLHAFCNFMGFPDFAEATRWPYDGQKHMIYIAYLFGILYFGSIIGMMLTTSNREDPTSFHKLN